MAQAEGAPASPASPSTDAASLPAGLRRAQSSTRGKLDVVGLQVARLVIADALLADVGYRFQDQIALS